MYRYIRKFNINGILIALLILSIPFLLFSHLLVDNYSDSISLFDFEYQHGFPSNQSFIYILLISIIPILLFSIWFIECNYWWRWVIVMTFFPWVDSLIRYKYSNKDSLPLILYSLLISIILFLFLLVFKYFKLVI